MMARFILTIILVGVSGLQLQEDASKLVELLGDPDPMFRERASKRLLELGKAAEEPHHKFLEILCDMKAEGRINSNHVRITDDAFPHVAINFRAAWYTWTV